MCMKCLVVPPRKGWCCRNNIKRKLERFQPSHAGQWQPLDHGMGLLVSTMALEKHISKECAEGDPYFSARTAYMSIHISLSLSFTLHLLNGIMRTCWTVDVKVRVNMKHWMRCCRRGMSMISTK
jgi:hypothetical protein